MEDIVIDTNVLMHASNPQEALSGAARQLIHLLLNGTTKIVVDEGFSSDEAKNQSAIGREYLDKIRHGSIAFALIIQLVSEHRITSVKKSAGHKHKKIICQMVRKPVDRIFLSVACNSQERVLVSHDFEDFSEPKRAVFRRVLKIAILRADNVLHFDFGQKVN